VKINHEEHEEFDRNVAFAAPVSSARVVPGSFAGPGRALFFIMRRIWQWLIIAVLAGAGCGQQAAPVSDFAAQRQRMVAEQLKARGISDDRVLAAMNKVQREEFAVVASAGE